MRGQDWITYCEFAAEQLKKAGFVLHCSSMKSEACYYRHPSRNCLIRIAAHRYGRTEQKAMLGTLPTAACITFGKTYNPKTWDAVFTQLYIAVGKYFMFKSDDSNDEEGQ